MRKGFWDRHGANKANCYKETYGEKLSQHKKKTIFEIIQRFYAAVLLEMDESNVDTWEV